MPWPMSQDYNEAIQNPAVVLQRPRSCSRPKPSCNAIGLPMPRSGNFADVYEMTHPSGKKWAVKCFTRQVPGLRERYAAISAYLKQANLPFMVDFVYLEQGIKVKGQWYPILKMDWVEGFTLNEFVKEHADNPPLLELLCQIWVQLARRLREAGMAHCDLQHGNVLLVPGSTAKSLSGQADRLRRHVRAGAGAAPGPARSAIRPTSTRSGCATAPTTPRWTAFRTWSSTRPCAA